MLPSLMDLIHAIDRDGDAPEMGFQPLGHEVAGCPST
jgi:hypothetical protein